MSESPPPWRVFDAVPASAAPVADRRAPLVAVAGIAAAVVLGLSAIVVVALGATPSVAGPTAPSEPAGSVVPSRASVGGIVVQVAGAVVRPGVYRFDPGARVADAIEAAGGYGPRVDAGRADRELDLASKLVDGRTIRVPSRDDPAAKGSSGPDAGAGSGAAPGLVDLNHATLAELDALPGIGPVTAQKIVDARLKQPFASPEELRSRGIVGDKTFERLKDLVTAR